MFLRAGATWSEYVVDVNWNDELKKKYDIDQLIELGKKQKGLKSVEASTDETSFGVTFLPSLSCDIPAENSFGFILWVNGRGLLVDPPPFTSKILTKMQISSSVIEWVIITQCNPRFDQGAF